MSTSLEILAEHRDALLLAEVAAWLHMFGKLHECFLEGNHSLDIRIPEDVREDFPQLTNLLEDSWTGDVWATLDTIVLEFHVRRSSIFNMIDAHRKHRERDNGKNRDRSKLQESSGFLRLMMDTHGRGSGTDKGILNRFAQEQEKLSFYQHL